MKINWKEVASSPGYKSLKKALIRDLGGYGRNMSGRRRKDLYKLFNWVIARAKHYAHHQNKSLSQVLNDWEAARDYWWLNYYGEYGQPKLGSGKPRNVKRMKATTYTRKHIWHINSQSAFETLQADKGSDARSKRRKLGKKDRWPMERKKRQARYRNR